MQYTDGPEAGYLAAYLLRREYHINSGEAVEIELLALVLSEQGEGSAG